MIKLILLGTQGCHLCEDAEALIKEYSRTVREIGMEYVDIAAQHQWQEEYAVRIPVLLHPKSGKELGWPFDLNAIASFVEGLNR